MSERRTYSVQLTINGRLINEVVIDPHYEIKHPDINDNLILELVKTLDGKDFQLESRDGEWEFYMLDRIDYLDKQYRLVWCFRDECLFIGVINCFRR
ncbi:MAG: hypothetical protein ABIQ95_14575 [Bdellovibrionia bacterium]